MIKFDEETRLLIETFPVLLKLQRFIESLSPNEQAEIFDALGNNRNQAYNFLGQIAVVTNPTIISNDWQDED